MKDILINLTLTNGKLVMVTAINGYTVARNVEQKDDKNSNCFSALSIREEICKLQDAIALLKEDEK
jgi:hypothetical protein